MNYYGAVQTSWDLLFQRWVQDCRSLRQKRHANNVRVDTRARVDRREASAKAHNGEVGQWMGGGQNE